MKKRRLILLFIACLLTACGPSSDRAVPPPGVATSPPSVVKSTPSLPEKVVPPDLEHENQVAMLRKGSTREQVVLVLGEPSGHFQFGDTDTFYFSDVPLRFRNDRLLEVPENLARELEQGKVRQQLLQARMRAENEQARMITKARPSSPTATRSQPNSSTPQTNQKIRRNGQKIDLSAYTGKGSVTIVDFFADWCGPCRRAEPTLLKLAEDPKVNLIQIDIVNWETPIVEQHGIRSVPNIRVYDRVGRQVGQTTSSVDQIKAYIAEAKKR